MFRPKNCVKIILLGGQNVGKTALSTKYFHQEFLTIYKASIGVDFLCKEIEIDNTRVSLQVWDTAGQESFRAVPKTLIRNCDGIILVYSLVDQKSYETLESWLQFLSETIENFNQFPKIIIANKSDLGREITSGATKAQELNIKYFETSAKDNTNIEQAFREIIDAAYRFNINYEPQQIQETQIEETEDTQEIILQNNNNLFKYFTFRNISIVLILIFIKFYYKK
eukprot:TRINITY_DN1939_c0_g1_i1.p1 TRINITY_DN1939_c0_g1~~TRINITY_DN1939_c0_g1_i1.p1  ORF type:complete len:225 (-),score=57.98 TRINITY_DN1939_c0_g1_i1:36-710(-)